MEYECPIVKNGKLCRKPAKCLVNNSAICRGCARKLNIVIGPASGIAKANGVTFDKGRVTVV